jgi:LysM repeat protein
VAVAGWVGGLAQDDGGLRLAGGVSTVVQPGDTLWSIARSVAGEADVRDVVDEIQRLNDLEGTTLVPGQVLELP